MPEQTAIAMDKAASASPPCPTLLWYYCASLSKRCCQTRSGQGWQQPPGQQCNVAHSSCQRICQQSANSTVIMRLLCPPAIRWAPDRQKLAALCEEEGVVLSWSHCRNGLAVQFLCLPGGHHRCLHVHKSSGVRDVHMLGKISTLHMHHERALLSREDRNCVLQEQGCAGLADKDASPSCAKWSYVISLAFMRCGY